MASCPSSNEAYWTSVLFILAVATILAANALLLHGSSQNPRRGLFSRKGRFIRPLLRRVMGSGHPRSRSTSISSLPPMLGAEQETPEDTAAAPPRSNELWDAAARWVRWDPNASTRAIVESWIINGDEDSAKRGLMGKRLAFGTSGLRGAMGPGFCRINDLVVIQTTQGLCRYLEKQGGEEFRKRGVVIGRDHRKQDGLSSEGFASLAAAVFVSRGFRVHLMGGTVATPLVAFGVSHTEACAGVMVTASHNPKKDNGYKVYWENGSQIIPPHDAGIAASIGRNLEPWQRYDPASAIAGPLCSDPTENLAEAYYRGIGEGLCRRPEANARSGLEVVYSAMHGVGDTWARRAFSCFSLPPFLSVGCQMEPDPEFPTVAFPNPEEQGALKEAMFLAEEKGVSLVLANDPDGDRLAVAERQPTGDWHIFSGNEIGALLGVWQWGEWRRTHPDEDASKAVMIASTVSSKMLSAVARLEGFTFEETLPGFKWMGHRGQQLKAQGMTILFAFEEAIGFGPGDVVFEKDGLSSAALFAEMVVALRDEDEAKTSATTKAAAAAAVPAMAAVNKVPAPPPPTVPPTPCPCTVATTPPDTTHGKTEPTKWTNKNAISTSPLPLPSNLAASPPSLPSPITTDESSFTAPPSPCSSAESGTPTDLRERVTGGGGEGRVRWNLATEGTKQQKKKQQQQQEEQRGFSSVLRRRLKALHERYGEFAEENGYVRCEDTEVVSKIFSRLRRDGKYRSAFGEYKVTSVRNLAEGQGFDSEMADGRPSLPLVAGGAHFLTFKFEEEGVVATLRTSGTEPKIKFYLEMQGNPGVPLDEVSARLSQVADVFVEEALQPKRWGIKRVSLA